jgi:hypothetical protein
MRMPEAAYHKLSLPVIKVEMECEQTASGFGI